MPCSRSSVQNCCYINVEMYRLYSIGARSVAIKNVPTIGIANIDLFENLTLKFVID